MAGERFIYAPNPEGDPMRLTRSERVRYAGGGGQNMADVSGVEGNTVRQQVNDEAEQQSFLNQLQFAHRNLLRLNKTQRRDFNDWLSSEEGDKFTRDLILGEARNFSRWQQAGEQTQGTTEPIELQQRREQEQAAPRTQEEIERDIARQAEIYERANERAAEKLQSFPSIEDMFNSISKRTNPKMWGENGDYPFVDPQTKKIRYDNIMTFVNSEINRFVDADPQEQTNFSQLMVYDAGGRSVPLVAYVAKYRHTDLFREHQKLVDQIMSVAYSAGRVRNYGLTVAQKQGGKDFPGLMTEVHHLNELTRPWFGGTNSMIESILNMSQDFNIENGQVVGDRKIGIAFVAMVDALSSLADREQMEDYFGKDCDLLNMDRLGDAIEEIAKTRGLTKEEAIKGFSSDWEKAKHDKSAYMELINVYSAPTKNTILTAAVKRLLIEMVGKKYHLYNRDTDRESATFGKRLESQGLDMTSLNLAWIYGENFAYMANVIALLDTSARGFSNVDVFRSWWARVRGVSGRGSNSGQLTTLNVLPKPGVPFMQAIVNDEGESIAQNFAKVRRQADDIARTEENQALNDVQKQNLLRQMRDRYTQLTKQDRFAEKAQSFWVRDQLMNAQALHDLLAEGKEFSFEKFTKYSKERGEYEIDRHGLYEAADSIIKKIRNMTTTFKVKFDQEDRREEKFKVPEYNKKTGKIDEEGLEVTIHTPSILGFEMIGEEVFDQPKYWNRDKNGKPLMNMLNEHEIDINTFEQKSGMDIVKDTAIALFTAMALDHRIAHAAEPAYGSDYYRAYIAGLSSIPQSAHFDRSNMENNRPVGHFFDHARIDWMRKKAHITDFDLWKLDLMRAIRTPGTIGEYVKGLFGNLGKVLVETMTK